jgi:AcrR family transcriptional regulator
MDLRMVKTRQQINKAFMILREKLMPDKIKVKDICDIAMINKTTFYHHYADSAELSKEIDNLAIERVMAAFSEKDKLFDDPRAYIIGLCNAIEHEYANLFVVFRGKQDVLCSRLEESLKKCYSDLASSVEDQIRLSFAIGGFIHVLKDHMLSGLKFNREPLTETTLRMLESIIKPRLGAPSGI